MPRKPRVTGRPDPSGSAAKHRLDVIPMLALSEPVTVAEVCVGPFRDLAATMFPTSHLRRAAQSMVSYHRLYNGGPIPNPAVIATAGQGPLPVSPGPAEDERIGRSIEAFRYAALLANRTGHGPNSTHLHLERYECRPGRGRYLTIRSRYVQLLGVQRHRQRSWAHVSPIWMPRGGLDRELLNQLGDVVPKRSKLARRLWRSLWWFNQAHHDDPYQPLEFSILCLATAFEALIRPSNKVADLQKFIRQALGTREFDDWVVDFYGARSAISHGDEAWQPLFGARAHIDHYRVGMRLFPPLVEHRLVELGVRSQPHPLLLSMARGHVARLLSSDEDLISRLEGHTFRTLRLRKNTPLRLEVRFLTVRLNHEDLSTPSRRYRDLLEWLRGIAIAACRSAAARWPADRGHFTALRTQFESGIPSIGGAHFIPHGVDPNSFFDEIAKRPEERAVLADISLADLADAMQEAEARREIVSLREK